MPIDRSHFVPHPPGLPIEDVPLVAGQCRDQSRSAANCVESIMWMRLAAAVCLVVSGGPIRVTAACVPAPPLCEAAARADLVFLGEVLEETTYVEHTERGSLPQGIQAVRFNVIRAFKGVEAGESWGLFYFGVDARSFKPGARYLVFAHRRATGASVTGCTLTREITRADEDAWFRTGAVELGACFEARP
jgi:hypothetical protein